MVTFRKVAHGSSDEVGDLAKTFNRMAECLRKEETLRRHLMSNVAHELRTPLTIMKTHVEAMSDGIVDKRKGLENIEGEIERLSIFLLRESRISRRQRRVFLQKGTQFRSIWESFSTNWLQI